MLRVTPKTRRRAAGGTIQTWESVRDAGSRPRKLWEAGEPDALKGARPVRGGEVRKGLAEIPLDVIIDIRVGQSKTQYLAGPLLYECRCATSVHK